jgi:hypothetical protein
MVLAGSTLPLLSNDIITILAFRSNRLYNHNILYWRCTMINPERNMTDTNQAQNPGAAKNCPDICMYTLALDISGRTRDRVSQTNRAVIDGTFGDIKTINALERQRTIPCGADDCPTMLQLTVRTDRGVTSYTVMNPQELSGGCSEPM